MPGYYLTAAVQDQRDIVWPKLRLLQRKYLADMEALYVHMTGYDNQVFTPYFARKFYMYKDLVRRLLTYLRMTKENLPLEFNMNALDSFAAEIVRLIAIFGKKR